MWVAVDGLDNLRDVGGITTAEGRTVAHNRLWRSENHTGLSAASRQRLKDLGVTDVIDLRSRYEVSTSASPFATDPEVSYHHLSYFAQDRDNSAEILDKALPWLDYQPTAHTGDAMADSYLAYLSDRPDSVVTALRTIANAPGVAVVHCAVGKDRTGMTIALALSLVGVSVDDIAAEYALTTERILTVVDRLWTDPTYASDSHDRDLSKLAARPEAMRAVFDVFAQYGGPRAMLTELGWTEADNQALRARLLD